jgi:tripartite-type tricarboxylate transporter receptor subunit TctC
MQSAELRDSFTRQGLEPQVTTPEAFGAYIRREVEQNAALILKSGVKGE